MLRDHLSSHHPHASSPISEGMQNAPVHDQSLPYHCNFCAFSFEHLPELTVHIRDNHGSPPLFPCKECEKVCSSKAALEDHVENHHDLDLESVIPQLDGQDDELELATNMSTNTVSTRTANYTLNQEKQTEKIVRDASKDDYEVNINNNDQNATVKCSPGFYIQVARASLGSLNNSSVLACGDIAISVDDTKITKDQMGIEATKWMSFSLTTNHRSSHVSVHLHHSPRTIQIQEGR